MQRCVSVHADTMDADTLLHLYSATVIFVNNERFASNVNERVREAIVGAKQVRLVILISPFCRCDRPRRCTLFCKMFRKSKTHARLN